MKRFFIILISLALVVVLSFSFTKPALSQEAPSDEFKNANTAYQAKVSDYINAREDYILKRSQYLSFKTLKSQTDAYDATLKMLKSRDDVLVSYMGLLSIRLKEALGMTEEKKSALQVRMNEETVWYEAHKNALPSAGTLDDLVRDSDKAREQSRFTYLLSYETLLYVTDGRMKDFRERSQTLLDDIKTKVNAIKSEEREEYRFDNEKLDLIDRWIFECESRLIRADQKQLIAESHIADLTRESSEGYFAKYNLIVSEFGEAQIYLKEANAYLGEVVSEIKREN